MNKSTDKPLPEAEFEVAESRWRSAFEASPGAAKRVFNRSGIEIQPLYAPGEGAGAGYLDTLGFPGEYPYTRGIYPEMYRKHPWMSRQYSGYGLPSETNERAHFIMSLGQQHLGNLAVVNAVGDIPSQVGVDSDEPLEAKSRRIASIRMPAGSPTSAAPRTPAMITV